MTSVPSAIALQEGQPLPEFSLPAAVPQADGGITEATITTGSLHGRPVVLFVYPKDATSGCTIEACNFRDLYDEFQQAGVQVLGLSRDNVRSHIRFIQNQKLPYPLLADDGGATIRSWGLIANKTMYGKPVTKVLRTTVVVDARGVIRRVFTNVTPLGHARQVLDAIRADGLA